MRRFRRKMKPRCFPYLLKPPSAFISRSKTDQYRSSANAASRVRLAWLKVLRLGAVAPRIRASSLG
jgi:hypothetical protein